MSLSEPLRAGAEALDLKLDAGQIDRLVRYLQLIEKWNRVYNLTAIRDVGSMVSQHLLDSLAVVPHLKGESLIDVGSGPGLPGVPLAIAQPFRRTLLLEANHKKAAFLRQVAMELDLNNVQVVHTRAEMYREKHYDVVISRAFADLSAYSEAAGHLVGQGGVLLAMKGLYPFEEIEKLPSGWTVRSSIALTVPGLGAERHLLEMVRT